MLELQICAWPNYACEIYPILRTNLLRASVVNTALLISYLIYTYIYKLYKNVFSIINKPYNIVFLV